MTLIGAWALLTMGYLYSFSGALKYYKYTNWIASWTMPSEGICPLDDIFVHWSYGHDVYLKVGVLLQILHFMKALVLWHVQNILVIRSSQLWNRSFCLSIKFGFCLTNFELYGSYTVDDTEIILCMCPANEIPRYSVMPFLIGWVHAQYDPFDCRKVAGMMSCQHERWPGCQLAGLIDDWQDSLSPDSHE